MFAIPVATTTEIINAFLTDINLKIMLLLTRCIEAILKIVKHHTLTKGIIGHYNFIEIENPENHINKNHPRDNQIDPVGVKTGKFSAFSGVERNKSCVECLKLFSGKETVVE